MTPAWISEDALLLLHAESLSEHGGAEGMRDAGLLASALARPRNLHVYVPDADIAALAAAYGYGLAKNHPFADGNKRASFLAIGLFLTINGWRLVANQADATITMLGVAADEVDEEGLADWIRTHSVPR